ncbi:Pyrethroid hydrolase Ces2e [Merluccius polli]|uniref:Carboxylic ester hydrolase n=1 Tax=Merluccius polli TaxID=89951 RepID=A0AA47MKJ4_MERPO|nr:Pyrethroid hydrolase Ces2e [Merluccius polli]
MGQNGEEACDWFLQTSDRGDGRDRFVGKGERCEGPVVQTQLGALRGQYVRVRGTETGVHAYLGVPFAEPPLGPLRLAPPQPAAAWDGLRDATRQPFICVQHKKLQEDMLAMMEMEVELPAVSEDCLYLNVHTPAGAAPDSKLPVMVWIHGGGFTMGSASMSDGSSLAAYQDVVVVVIQYRLGPLGFLSTGDEHIPGNAGLLDQVQALRWVQQNVRSFGGDPDRVTVFGESAGGVSASLLVGTNTHSHFHTAQTPSLLWPPASSSRPSLRVADALGCDANTEKMAKCLRNMGTDALVALSLDPTMRFLVSVDGRFLTEQVNTIYQRLDFPKIPFMTGVNSDEGGWLLPTFMAPANWTEGMDREPFLAMLGFLFPDVRDRGGDSKTFIMGLNVLSPSPVCTFPPPKPKDALKRELLADEYLGNAEDRDRNRRAFTDVIGDLLFKIPAVQTANAHRDAGAPVYLYEYRYSLARFRAKRPNFVGCDHGDDIWTVLGLCFSTHDKLAGLCTEEEDDFSKLVMTYWGNFARTG